MPPADDYLSIKRRALLGAVTTLTGGIAGCTNGHEGTPSPSTQKECPIDWQPEALAPVFYGFQKHEMGDGSSWPYRVYYPSLEENPHNADILDWCSHYPLILFSHGECEEDAGHNYDAWVKIPATLARSGYVVAVPEIHWKEGIKPPDYREGLQRLDDLVDWIHESWEHREWMFPGKSHTGVVGHSWGALLSARYAAENDVSAYAAIGGAWSGDSQSPGLLKRLEIPKLFCWGSEEVDATEINRVWDSLSKPKHKAVFKDTYHWDFLREEQSTCASKYADKEERGDCTLTRFLTNDLTVMFFGKYMRSGTGTVIGEIPATLIPPELDLDVTQEDYARLYLQGFDFLNSTYPCEVRLTWERATESGTTTEPG